MEKGIDTVTNYSGGGFEVHQLSFTGPAKRLLQMIVDSCEEHVSEHRELMPVMHLLNADGKMEVIGGMFTDDRSKDEYADFCRRRAEEFGADMVVFCAESWILSSDRPDIVIPPGGLKDHPNAESCVVVMVNTPTASYLGQGLIKTKGKDRFMDKMLFVKQDEGFGRFMDILPKSHATVH